MHWQKFMNEASEQRTQYKEGLITEAELLACTQSNLNKMIEQTMEQAKSTLLVFGYDAVEIPNGDPS